MKKFYSLVLMAAALLVGTNAWADYTPVFKVGDVIYAYDGTLAKPNDTRTEADGGVQVYKTVDKAWTNAQTACQENGTIQLVDNCVLTSNKLTISKNLTLDLNGYNITNTYTGLAGNCHAIAINASKALVINNSSNEQSEIKSTMASSYPINFGGANSTVTINGNIVLTSSNTSGTQIFVGSYEGITINNNTSDDFKIMSHKRFTNNKNGNPYSTNVIIGTLANFTTDTDAQNWVNWFATYSNAKISVASQINMHPDYFETLKEYLEDQNVNTLLTLTGTQVPTLLVSTSALTPKPIVVEIGEVEYHFTSASSAMSQSSAEHPATLTDDWISTGTTNFLPSNKNYNYYLDLNGHTYYTNNSSYIMKNGKLTISNSAEQPAYIRPSDDQQLAVILIKPSTITETDLDIQLNIGQNIIVKNADKALANGISFEPYDSSKKERLDRWACKKAVLNFDGQIDVTSPECSAMYTNGDIITYTAGNEATFPVINIKEHAVLNATKDVAIYGAGYAKWNIEDGASITGTSAIAIKSGILNMTGGTLHATMSEKEAGRQDTWGNGVNAAGAALQIESNKDYAGQMELTISGGELISDGFYAIYEYGNGETAVKAIAVTGGNFQGGILASQDFMAKHGAFVSGGKWSKDITANVIAGKAANPIDDDPYFFKVGTPTEATAQKENAGQNAVLVNADASSSDISDAQSEAGRETYVTSTATNSVIVTENTDVVVAGDKDIVEVKKVTVEGDAQLNVKEGATLMVGAGSVLLDEGTTTGGLTVEAGATLVVDGLIYGSTEDNFVIESQEGKSGIVLFSPKTEFIKEDHPKATYRFTSKAFWSQAESKWVYQRFGVPTFDGHATLQWLNNPGGGVNSWVKKWDYKNDDWTSWTAFTADQLEINDALPFQGLMLASDNVKPDNTNPAMVYEFTGSLMGNSDANLHFYYGWNYYANSYTAPININEFIQTVKTSLGGSNDILATIYLYQDLGNDTYTWQAVNEFTAGSSTVVGFAPGVGPIYENVPSVINPMQAFLMRLNVEGEANQTIDYADNVYTPATTNTLNPAPARNRVTNNSMQISVFNANGNFDKVFFVENDNFSNDLDNGFDAYKYDGNKGVSLYAMSADKHMEILASNDVDGSFIGINAPEAGNYTLYFSGIQGMNYALIDMTNNTVVTIEEGGQFNFYAEAGQNDYRFQLVAPARVPTAVENVGAKADVKGVYTITGQYLGEDINALPKGVYIINGAKVVK